MHNTMCQCNAQYNVSVPVSTMCMVLVQGGADSQLAVHCPLVTGLPCIHWLNCGQRSFRLAKRIAASRIVASDPWWVMATPGLFKCCLLCMKSHVTLMIYMHPYTVHRIIKNATIKQMGSFIHGRRSYTLCCTDTFLPPICFVPVL